jgi:hypothetical protein
MPSSCRILIAAALMAHLLGASAHDTWFQPLGGSTGAAAPELALGTGNRYPVQETGVGAEYLEHQGCVAPGHRDVERPMQPLRNIDNALVLRPPAQAGRCWAQLVPLDIELEPAMVSLYLEEVQAPAAVRTAWRVMQSRGLPWKERYTKHARIDLVPAGTEETRSASAPVPMAMDILRGPRPAGGHAFQVLSGGVALADQAMELIGERGTRGIWRRTNAQGLIEFPALPAGRWLLRGTLLRLSSEDPERWDSGFVTLAFEVAGASTAPSLSSAAR